MDSYHDTAVIPSLMKSATGGSEPSQTIYWDAPDIDLSVYDNIVVCMSGGKDSIATLLHLIEVGADKSRIELWHHDVDGREGSHLMDWHFMTDYNTKLAKAFGLPIYFSWLEGGFEGEMLKQDSYSRPHKVETPDGLITLDRDNNRSKPGTRLKFPQVAASLQTRWCSSALKIDVGRRALNNQARFEGKTVLFVTGERREESANRARYNQLEPHACDRRNGRKARHVDAWRPILHWSEAEVWACLERHLVTAPVPYRLGWGRSSCMTCIFNDARIWATILHHFPDRAEAISAYEDSFGTTISRDRVNARELAKRAKPIEIDDVEALEQAVRKTYHLPILSDRSKWRMPAGAFSKSGCGAV